MIYLIIGGSCAGKSSFVKNSFLKNAQQIDIYKDILTITETEKTILIGPYDNKQRKAGTDFVARQHVKYIGEQVERLLSKNKDIVLEGTKIVSRPLFDFIKSLNVEVKLILISITAETSFIRNQQNNSTISFKTIKSEVTKANNIFNEYADCFNGEIIVTDDIDDFTNFDITYKKERLIKRPTLFDFEE